MSDTSRDRSVGNLLLALPADILLVIGFSIIPLLVALNPARWPSSLSSVVVLPLFLFFPGYVLVSALFPEAEGSESRPDAPQRGLGKISLTIGKPSISSLERVVFSVGTSAAIVPLFGLLIHRVYGRLTPLLIVVPLAVLTIIVALFAGQRRLNTPKSRRFRISGGKQALNVIRSRSKSGRIADVMLVVGGAVLISALLYSAVSPSQSFTSFYLLSEGDSGSLVAEDYPRQFTVGEAKPVYVGIENREQTDQTYTVVVSIQRMEAGGEQVAESEELGRFQLTVPSGETRQQRYSLTPTLTGKQLRVQYLLYRGQPPTTPTDENAYRHTHLWIEVAS